MTLRIKTVKTRANFLWAVVFTLLFSAGSMAEEQGIDINLDSLFDETSTDIEEQPTLPERFVPAPLPEAAVEPTDEELVEPEAAIHNEENVIIDVVEVTESFYRVQYDADSGQFVRRQTLEAGPGDIIEVVVTAVNKSDVAVQDIQMVHSLPRGPVSLLEDSISIDQESGAYRVSQTGVTFFPPEAEVPAANIRFIEWQLLYIGVNETQTLSYRIQINN